MPGGVMAGKSRRGFASMSPEKQREIASKGGRAAHAKGTAHEWTRDEARHAGRKGGVAVSRDRDHMSAIGKDGGEARSAAVRAARLRRPLEREVAIGSGQQYAGFSDRRVADVRVASDRRRAQAPTLPANPSGDRHDDRAQPNSA